jgi:hypothetical protein
MAVRDTPSKGGKPDKLWRDALMVAVKRTDKDGRVLLSKIAEKCVLAAAEGDLQAMKEIGDRIDGKPNISMDVTTIHERNPEEWTERELDGEIARLRAARIAGGKAASGPGASKPH